MSLLKDIIEIIFVSKCVVCEKISETICDGVCRDCLEKIIFIQNAHCDLCGKPLKGMIFEKTDFIPKINCGCKNKKQYFSYVRAIGMYEGVLKDLIHILKFKKKIRIAKLFIKWLNEYIEKYFNLKEIDLLIPVPLHKKKLLARGFNQAVLLVEGINKKYKIPHQCNNLIRVRATQPQFELNKKQRYLNLKDAFKVKFAHKIKEKKILLIDDLCTTGITINECAKILIKAGAKEVFGFTVAHG